MQGAIVVGVVAPLAVLALGAAVTASSPRSTRPGPLAALRSTVHTVTDAMVRQVGRFLTAALTVICGIGVMVLVLWPLGRMAKLVEPGLDVPLFRWFESRQDPTTGPGSGAS